MEYSVDSPAPWRRLLTIKVPAERAEETRRRVSADFAKRSRLPGFRPGKAPLPLVEKAYQGEIHGKTIETLVVTAFDDAIRELAIVPLTTPSIQSIDEKDGGVSFVASIEVNPEITPVDYKEVPVTVPRIEVGEGEVNEVLESLRERSATLQEPASPRTCRNGDVVVIDLAGAVEGKPTPTDPLTDFSLELGRGEITPLIEQGMIGMGKGGHKTIEVTFPPDERNAAMAGKNGSFEVTVKEIKEKILPEVNDEFARGLGEYSGLGELKAKISEQLRADGAQMTSVRVRRGITEHLLERNTVEVPPSAVERHIDVFIDEGIRGMRQRGMETGHLRPDDPALRDQFRAKAEREVRRELILESIARVEGIAVAPEEIQAEVGSIAARLGQPAEEVARRLVAMGSMKTIEDHVRDEKTLAFLEKHASLTEVSRQEYERQFAKAPEGKGDKS